MMTVSPLRTVYAINEIGAIFGRNICGLSFCWCVTYVDQDVITFAQLGEVASQSVFGVLYENAFGQFVDIQRVQCALAVYEKVHSNQRLW